MEFHVGVKPTIQDLQSSALIVLLMEHVWGEGRELNSQLPGSQPSVLPIKSTDTMFGEHGQTRTDNLRVWNPLHVQLCFVNIGTHSGIRTHTLTDFKSDASTNCTI